MAVKKFLLVGVCSGLLFSCSDNNQESQENYANYLDQFNYQDSDALKKKYLHSEALYQQLLEDESIDGEALDILAHEYKKSLYIKAALEREIESATSAEKLQAFYDANKAEFSEQYRLVNLYFLPFPLGASEAERQAVTLTAQSVYSQLQSGVEAKQIQQTFPQLRVFNNHRVEPGLYAQTDLKNVFAADNGELLNPITSSEGVHVIEPIAELVDQVKPFDQVSSEIKYQLATQVKANFAGEVAK